MTEVQSKMDEKSPCAVVDSAGAFCMGGAKGGKSKFCADFWH